MCWPRSGRVGSTDRGAALKQEQVSDKTLGSARRQTLKYKKRLKSGVRGRLAYGSAFWTMLRSTSGGASLTPPVTPAGRLATNSTTGTMQMGCPVSSASSATSTIRCSPTSSWYRSRQLDVNYDIIERSTYQVMCIVHHLARETSINSSLWTR